MARSTGGGHTRAAPLLAHKRVPLDEVVGYPLVLCHPQVCQECSRQCERLLRLVETPLVVAEYVTTHSLMLALVAAGYGVGFSTAAHVVACRQADVIVRPLDEDSAALTTYLLHPEGAMSEPLRHFIDRAACRPYAVGYATARMRLFQAGWPIPFWSNRQTCFVIAGFH